MENQNNNTTETLNLTPEELQLIEITRKEKALAQEKKDAEQALARGKEIEAIKATIKTDAIFAEQLNIATTILFTELDLLNPGAYEIVKRIENRKYECYNYKSVAGSESVKDVYFEHTSQLLFEEINHIESKIKIVCYEHLIYSSSYARTPSKRELVFKVKNCGYDNEKERLKSAKTINKHIVGIQQVKSDEVAKENETETRKAWLAEFCKQAHPNAVCNSEILAHGGPTHFNRNSKYYYTKVVVCKFENKFAITYTADLDHTTKKYSARVYGMNVNGMDQDTVINLLAK